jgi:hypothetical protein
VLRNLRQREKIEQDGKIKIEWKLEMGWLREHSALKVTPIRDRSASPFDEIEFDDSLYEHEQAQWERWKQRSGALGEKMLAQATQEIEARAAQPRKRGRPATLLSYKEYKRFFLQEWAQFITTQALKIGMSQDELASLFNKAWDGANWRELLRADNRQYRMVYGANKVMNDKRWNVHRRGNLATIWTRQLMSQAEFEKWVVENSPQFHHTELPKSSEDELRAAKTGN